MNGKKYIYNHEQANFFMEFGCRCIGTGLHRKTNTIFWIFNYDECQPAYIEWLNRKH